ARHRADPRGGAQAGGACGGHHRPPHRASRHPPPDVALRRHDAPGGAEPESGSRRGQGRGHELRAGDSRGGARPPRHRAPSRHGHAVRAHLRLPGGARTVLLPPRRHARGAAWDHRARPRAAVTMNETQTLLADTCTRLFTAEVTPALIESAEKGTWPGALWGQLEENGLTLPQIPEATGGAGGQWADAQVVLSATGRFAVPLPVAETMIGAWLLSESRLSVPMGPITVAPVRHSEKLTLVRDGGSWRLSGTAVRVPWGASA